MKKLLWLALLLAGAAAYAIPVTNTTTLTSIGGHDWDDFDYDVAGFDDQVFVYNIPTAYTNHTWTYKIAKDTFAGQVAYVIVSNADITVTSGTNITFSVARTNIPPNAEYKASLRAQDLTSGSARDLVRGIINVTDSIYDDDDSTYAFPSDADASAYLLVADAGSVLATGKYSVAGDTLEGNMNVGGYSLTNSGPLYITEQADADADVAGAGQIWVNTATPNELWWTDDAGTDTQLGVSSAEVNDLEGTAPSSIQSTEIFIGTGAGTGTNAALSGDATMDNAGVVTVAATLTRDTEWDSIAELESATSTDIVTTNANDITKAQLEALLSDVANILEDDVAETLTANWVNTANPWADNEVANNLTIEAGSITLTTFEEPTPTAEGVIQWESDDDHILVGDGIDAVEFVPTEDVSGDATMDNAGAVTVAATHSGSAHHDAVTLAASVTDILDLTTQAISADDPAGDRVLFWDDSESKLEHLQIGANLSISGTTLAGTGNATAVGAYGSIYVSTALVNSPDGVTKEKLGGDSGATGANVVSGFTHTSPGRLTYTGTDTRKFHVSAVLSIIHDSNSTICEYYIATNGTVIANSQIDRKIGTGADVGALGLEWTVELATGDYIEIWSDDDKTGNMTVNRGVISIQETQVSGIVNDDIDTFAELDAIVADKSLGTVTDRTIHVTPRTATLFTESDSPSLGAPSSVDSLNFDDATLEWMEIIAIDQSYEASANWSVYVEATVSGATTGSVDCILRHRTPPDNGSWTVTTNSLDITSVDETAPASESFTFLPSISDGAVLEIQVAFTNAIAGGPDTQLHDLQLLIPVD